MSRPGFTGSNVSGLTLRDGRIDGANASWLSGAGCPQLVIRGGAFTNSRLQSGILISKAPPPRRESA